MAESAPASVWVQRFIAWAVVGLPAAWGVAQVVQKSAALFQ